MTREGLAKTAASFVASLPWAIDVLWQGTSGVHVLDDDRRATITLATRGHSEHYQGFDVAIASKTHGPLVAKWFGFDEYLGRDDRLDERPDYPTSARNPCYEVISYCGWEWYIGVPAHPELFTQAVEAWLEAWR